MSRHRFNPNGDFSTKYYLNGNGDFGAFRYQSATDRAIGESWEQARRAPLEQAIYIEEQRLAIASRRQEALKIDNSNRYVVAGTVLRATIDTSPSEELLSVFFDDGDTSDTVEQRARDAAAYADATKYDYTVQHAYGNGSYNPDNMVLLTHSGATPTNAYLNSARGFTMPVVWPVHDKDLVPTVVELPDTGKHHYIPETVEFVSGTLGTSTELVPV